MVMLEQIKPMTAEAFDAWIRLPENVSREFEFIGGRVREVVANPVSSAIGSRINGFMFIYLQGNDIGHLTGADGGYIVSGERYIPDVAFISYARQPELEYYEGYIPQPPDLAVEVLSPSNDDETLHIKTANYLAAGTTLWVANYEKRRMEVFRPGKPAQLLGVEDFLDGGDILPGFRLVVKDIFPPEKKQE